MHEELGARSLMSSLVLFPLMERSCACFMQELICFWNIFKWTILQSYSTDTSYSSFAEPPPYLKPYTLTHHFLNISWEYHERCMTILSPSGDWKWKNRSQSNSSQLRHSRISPWWLATIALAHVSLANSWKCILSVYGNFHAGRKR